MKMRECISCGASITESEYDSYGHRCQECYMNDMAASIIHTDDLWPDTEDF